MSFNQPTADQEQMTRYADLRDEISQIRKVFYLPHYLIFYQPHQKGDPEDKKLIIRHISFTRR